MYAVEPDPHRIIFLVKAAQMNDPQVNQAIEQTEAELKKRELDLQGKHQEVLSHGKATLELKQDLARQQVKAHLQSADLEEFKQQYEKAKEDATKLLAEKEAEYKQQMEEAQAKIKAAQVNNLDNYVTVITQYFRKKYKLI